jgi:hypothetical protein
MEYLEILISVLRDHDLKLVIIAALIFFLLRSEIKIEYPKR